MTRTRESRGSRTSRWALQDAKARFSEVVRKAKTEGPQPTGEVLANLLRDSPLRAIHMERVRTRSRVRDIEL